MAVDESLWLLTKAAVRAGSWTASAGRKLPAEAAAFPAVCFRLPVRRRLTSPEQRARPCAARSAAACIWPAWPCIQEILRFSGALRRRRLPLAEFFHAQAKVLEEPRPFDICGSDGAKQAASARRRLRNAVLSKTREFDARVFRQGLGASGPQSRFVRRRPRFVGGGRRLWHAETTLKRRPSVAPAVQRRSTIDGGRGSRIESAATRQDADAGTCAALKRRNL